MRLREVLTFHSGMRRMRSAIAKHSWVLMAVSVAPVTARKWSSNEFLEHYKCELWVFHLPLNKVLT